MVVHQLNDPSQVCGIIGNQKIEQTIGDKVEEINSNINEIINVSNEICLKIYGDSKPILEDTTGVNVCRTSIENSLNTIFNNTMDIKNILTDIWKSL